MKCFSKAIFGVWAAMLGAIAVLVLCHVKSWGKDAGPVINVETTPVNRSASPAASFAPIVKKAGPSVVNIYSTRIVQERYRRYFNDPVFQQFQQYFGDQIPGDTGVRTQKELGFGSGVIVAPNGYILTANHVVAGMTEIKVAIANDKKEYIATVVGTDPETDVAVLKIDAKDLPAITLGDSDQLEVGDIVLAIGNPFGIARQAGQTTSVTMGIISALGRSDLDFGGEGSHIQDFIQTDAAINPGNSGGALVDAEGRLIGINTAIKSSSDGSEGIGFAVPINMARGVMERIISGGKITRAFMGVNLQDLDAGLAVYFNLPDQNGALVDDATPGSSAAKAGIQSGDVIVAFNGKEVTDAHNLILAVSDCLPGSQATLKLIRDGKTKTINVTLGQKVEPVENENVQSVSKPSGSKTDALDGVGVSDIDGESRQYLKIPYAVHGALVTDVSEGSNSAYAGLQRGDVMEEINHQAVTSAQDAINICTQAKGDWIFLKVWQRGPAGGNTRYLSVDNTK